jgi:hypothetical protein
MASQHLAIISEPRSTPCEQQRRNLLRKWLGLFALNAGQPLDADALSFYVTLWLEGFADLPTGVLEAAFNKTLATCKFWPVKIADVREQIDQAEAKGFELEAEAEWNNVLEGIHCSAPRRFPAATEHAIRATGGLRFIERCSESELVWCRKTFLAAYKNVHETGQLEHLLGAGEARRILAQLQAGPPIERKQILRAIENPSEPPSREEVQAVLLRVSETPKPKELSESELRAWQERQKKALREWRVSHGLPEDFTEAEMQTSAAVQDTVAKLIAAKKT